MDGTNPPPGGGESAPEEEHVQFFNLQTYFREIPTRVSHFLIFFFGV